jgi:hypothetical protein
VPGDQRVIALHLVARNLADAFEPIGFGVGQLAARIGFARGFDAARLRTAFGGLDARQLLGLGLELALLDRPSTDWNGASPLALALCSGR